MQRITITSTRYHARYRTFSPSLAYLQRITTFYCQIYFEKTYINIFLKKLMITCGNALQIAQNQTNLRENI